MSTTAPLDVLLLEAAPGDGAADGLRLAAAGHRVHRCDDGPTPWHAHPTTWVPCSALTNGTCPLDHGVDVALLARRGVVPRPGVGEVGVRCAVRAGVPVVEDGGDLLDPFAPWITRRVEEGDVVGACEAAAADALAPVLDRLRILAAPLLDAVGADATALSAHFDVDGEDLTVRVIGPEVPESVGQAIGQRVVQALQAVPRRFRTVGVSYVPDHRV